MKRIYQLALAALLCGSWAVMAENSRPMTGTPLPWPFPWARQCPVDWSALSGHHRIWDHQGQRLDLWFAPLPNGRVRVSLFRYGVLQARGYGILTNGPTLKVLVWPARAGVPRMRFHFRFHYMDERRSCSMNSLVPVLIWENLEATAKGRFHYYLLKKE